MGFICVIDELEHPRGCACIIVKALSSYDNSAQHSWNPSYQHRTTHFSPGSPCVAWEWCRITVSFRHGGAAQAAFPAKLDESKRKEWEKSPLFDLLIQDCTQLQGIGGGLNLSSLQLLPPRLKKSSHHILLSSRDYRHTPSYLTKFLYFL